jgi:23S rRNA pseudouridine2605 synthase
MADNSIRLQKFLSECGIASRRRSEELISAGKVKVNGRTASLGEKINPKVDTISVNGKKVINTAKHVYLMLHKPRGFITTMNDEMGRKCVSQLVEDVGERVYPIGRLDRESEGLLLMTNDGEFANAMMHPSHHIGKVYRVTIRPGITQEQIDLMSGGIEIEGRTTAPCDVRLIKKDDDRTVLEIVLYEGRNRQIRKVCEKLNIEVARLKRTAFGAVKLGMLPAGKWRELSKDEVNKLISLTEKRSIK